MDLTSGAITVDGIPNTGIPLEILRSRLVVLPQHPYLLPGSVRRNVDPENNNTPEAIQSVLEKVGLWTLLSSTGTVESSLDSHKLSPGQKQLFVLARAMLMRPKVLVLDEATSNLDHENDKLMQKLIREEFDGCTIIAIAHRLNSISDFDTVAVMDGGNLVELGNPRVLAKQNGSLFGEMLKGQACSL
jgi:ATP-binding cassette subfamily C (CFTR/MRP) protein 1